jgi:hypothetical protein
MRTDLYLVVRSSLHGYRPHPGSCLTRQTVLLCTNMDGFGKVFEVDVDSWAARSS